MIPPVTWLAARHLEEPKTATPLSIARTFTTGLIRE